MMKLDDDMWSYWQNKYGPVLALEDYYPKYVESNLQLQLAIAMIKNGERLIDSIMEEATDNYLNEEYEDG